MGRILRDHGLDATAGTTEVEACAGRPEADCFALKRQGGPLDAAVSVPDPACDLACVLSSPAACIAACLKAPGWC